VPVSLPNVGPIAFLHPLRVPRFVLEAKRLAPDHKPLVAEMLLEPQARVSLKHDIAHIYRHYIAGVRTPGSSRKEVPDIIEPIDRDLGVLRLFFENGISRIVET
jgi:hypothetical protein